jgi:ATP-dependent phosphoenolpyruvate carboxykinase
MTPQAIKAQFAQATKLAKMFQENFKQFEPNVTDEIKAAGPKA